MFDFLKKSFPTLKKESPYYIQALTGFIVKLHDEHEPLAGQDVFLGEFLSVKSIECHQAMIRSNPAIIEVFILTRVTI